MAALKTFFLLCVIFCVHIVLVKGQVDGSFWWNNKDLLQKARESRQNKRVEFKEDTDTTTASSSIEDHDCICVHKCRCQVEIQSQRGSICGATDHVCCHIIKLPIPSICIEIERNATSTESPIPSTTVQLPISVTGRTIDNDNFVYPNDDRLPQYSFLLKVYLRNRRRAPTRICGATLINRHSAITAQHCIRGSQYAPDFMVKTADNQLRIISQIIRHPEFYSGGLYNDLAILKWEEAIRIYDLVDVIEPTSSSIQRSEYSDCKLVAFETDQSDPERLIEVQETATLLDNAACESRIRSKWGDRFKLHNSFLCIDTDRPASCASPSSQSTQGKLNIDGHPLVCHTKGSDHPMLVGVMSWYSCTKEHPDVLSRAVLQWISEAPDIS